MPSTPVHPLGNEDVEDVATNVGSAEARLVLRQGCCGMVLVVDLVTITVRISYVWFCLCIRTEYYSIKIIYAVGAEIFCVIFTC